MTKRWVVAKASGGQYRPECLRMVDTPEMHPADGQLLVRTILLSLDPTHLNWIKLDPELQFLPINVGDPMVGTNVGIVLESRHPEFIIGQAVIGTWGWGQTAIAEAGLVRAALPEAEMAYEDQLTILSHVGFAAVGGMVLIGGVKPDDAVLVSAAAGATGSIAAQYAKSTGCRTVGIAGGPEKCRYLLDELGLDGAIDYRRNDVEAQIKKHFPNGVDLYFDNVGGSTLDTVLQNMALRCRIVICGAIAQYDAASAKAFAGIHNLPMLIFRQARMEGFVAHFDAAGNDRVHGELVRLYRSGGLKAPKHMVSFQEMPAALQMLLDGSNRGKLIARAI